ncbi:CsgG/HfaB family protein [Hyalangium gracile]|uniref:CsgG/HfaB family protein n=1 Tax=Hyalangium gracile TaxID=394092 RepID=UPI001CCE0DD0|nr:CsgG/HfaB family protein [Hyalangium gracile]
MHATVGLLVGLWALSALAGEAGPSEPPVAATQPPSAEAAPPAPASPTSASATAIHPDEKPRLLVADLAAQGVSAEEAAALTDALVQTLSQRGLFQVISRRDVQTVLSTERQRQMLGACDEDPTRCATDVGTLLQVRYVMTGSLSRLGSTYELALQMLDTVKARPVGRSTRLAKKVETLRELVPWAAAEASGSPLPPPASRVLPYSLLAGGGAALVGGGVYGLIALSRQKVLNDELCPARDEAGQCTPTHLRELSYYQQQNDKLGRDKTVSLALMGVGAALVGLGLWRMPPPEGGPRVALVPTGQGMAVVGVLP